jgi:predicted TIM-barrel fold metal-dependent hydrolase
MQRRLKNASLSNVKEGPHMLSRRSFLNGTLGAGLALASQGPQPATAQGTRRRMIVDAQVHLWKAQAPDRPWPPGRVAQLPEPFGYDKLLPMMNEAGVDRVVIVPPSWEGERNDYALEAAGKYPDRFGIMGRIPLNNPQLAATLPKWKEQKGMLGMRVTFNANAVSWITDGTADWFWPAAEKAGIPVMFLGGGMANYARVAERHPQLQLIIDHMGLSLDIAKANKRGEAIDQTVSLAKYPNVSIKLTSAPTYSSEHYPYRDMAPFIRRCFDAFGPRRCFWGTDMTNSFAKATYRQRITHFTEELDFLSEDDKDWVMGRAVLSRLGWA